MNFKTKLVIYNINKSIAKRGLETGGRVQQYVDNEVLKLSDPYIPFLSGNLKKSGIRHTVIGSGKVRYKTPYARRQYYTNAGRGIQGLSKGGNRGKYWFERMKNDHLNEILDGAAKIAGGRGDK